MGAGDDDGLGSAGEGHGQEQAVQAIDVVAVEVGDADQIDGFEAAAGAAHGGLGAFAAVDEQGAAAEFDI